MIFIIRSLVCYSIIIPSLSFAQGLSNPEGKNAVLKIQETADFELTGDSLATPWRLAQWTVLPQRERYVLHYKTKVKLLYSTTGIYCLFWCEDKEITATLKEDFADLYKEDVVEIFFWTDEKMPIYFEYELSPLNYELAIIVPNDNGNFFGWKPWHYEGNRLTRHNAKIINNGKDTIGWLAEFFIPYTLLKPLGNVPPRKGMQWRVNMYRIDYDNGISEWSWQPTRTNFHDYEKFGTLLFD